MGLLKDEWNSTAFFKTIQGNNYPYTALKNAYNTMDSKGNTSGSMNTSLVFNWNNLRYPGRHSNNNNIARSFLNTSNQIYKDTFDGLSVTNQSSLSNIYSLDYMPRLCPVMQSAKTVVENIRDSQYYSAQYHVEVKRSYEPYSPSTSGYYPELHISKSQPISDFIDKLSDDDLCVFSYKIYENKSTGINGIISNWNASSGVVYDVFTPMMFKATANNPGNFNTGFTAYLSSVLPPNMSFSPVGDMRWIEYDSTPYGLKVACFANIESGTYNTSNQSIIYGSKAAWTRFFDKSGFEWSFDEKVVQDPESPYIRKPIEPGQPENPVIDDPGDGDNISDPVEYPDPPYIPNTTVYDRYFLSPNQMLGIKKFLFSDTFIGNIKRLWTNPAEYVISLVCYPFDVGNTGLGTTNDVVSIGGVTSDVVATALTDRGVPYFYGGSVFVDNYYNSYLDYEPYTSIDIYIPYIGVRPLNVSQVVGHTLCIGYYIDLNTQQITALLGLDGDNGNLGQVLTQYVGSIGVQTPLSGTSAQDMIRNIVAQTSGLITGIGAIAGGVMGANPALLSAGVSKTSSELLGGGHTAPSYYGSLSPVSGLFTPQIAYLIINRPRQAIPAAYLSQQGFSSSFSGKVSEFSGYLECASVNISSGNTMTEQEQNEIIRLLTGGIYI